MAARTHAIHDYSFAGSSARPRRQVWLRDDDDEVVLPRGRRSSITGALLVSAALATALVGGAAYAVYRAAPPPRPVMAETPSAPLHKEWPSDPLVMQATALSALYGTASPSSGAASLPAGAPMSNRDATEATPGAFRAQDRSEVILNDSAPGFQESLPQPSPEPASSEPAFTAPTASEPQAPDSTSVPRTDAPYPPVTTPPEMMLPASPSEPATEGENPY